MENIVLTSATNQASEIRKKNFKSSDLLKMHFDQIDKFNPEIFATSMYLPDCDIKACLTKR